MTKGEAGMRKTILIYAIALAALTGILKFIEYRYLSATFPWSFTSARWPSYLPG